MKLRTIIPVLVLFACVLAAADDSPPALLAAGRADEAITSLRSKLSSSPSDADSHNLLCRVYFSMGDWDHGISACEKAVALDPNNSGYHLWLGRIYGEKADAANFLSAASLAGKVRTEFETAVRLDPNNVERAATWASSIWKRPESSAAAVTRPKLKPRRWPRLMPRKLTISRAGWPRNAKTSPPPKKNIAPRLKPVTAAR